MATSAFADIHTNHNKGAAMKVFQDVFTNDIVMSDRFAHELAHSDVIMRVQSKYAPKDSQQAASEEDLLEQVLDIPYSHDLVETSLTQNDFMPLIKTLVQRIQEHLEKNGQSNRVAAFKAGTTAFIKDVTSNFNAFSFYTGKSEDLRGAIIFSRWEDDDAPGPVFYFFKDALREAKA